MHRRQKAILTRFIAVITVTTITVIAMVFAKNLINRSEATRAMQQLGQQIMDYQKVHRTIPSEAVISDIKENIEGRLRLGNLAYRARWIRFDCPPDEILAYTEENYNSLFMRKGYIVLRLNGKVEWMEKHQFKLLLDKQQSPLEAQMMKK